jgi:hypothetical protein
MPAEMNLDAILSLFLEVDVERPGPRFGQLEALRREVPLVGWRLRVE